MPTSRRYLPCLAQRGGHGRVRRRLREDEASWRKRASLDRKALMPMWRYACAPQKVYPMLIARFRPTMVGYF